MTYPSIPPNFGVVKVSGGFTRSCFVVELLSIGDFTPVQKAWFKERLEAALKGLQLQLPIVEKFIVSSDDQFNRPLTDALHLPYNC